MIRARIFRFFLPVLALLTLGCSLARAQAAEMGMLNVTVLVGRDTPIKDMTVLLLDPATKVEQKRLTTDARGKCFALVAVGDYSLLAERTEQAVTVQAGEGATATMTLPLDHGALVTAAWEDGTPFVGEATAAYRENNPDAIGIKGYATVPGEYWFPQLPATARQLGVIVATPGDPRLCSVMQKCWDLDQDKPLRRLAMSGKKSKTPLKIKVIDPRGNPLKNMPITASVIWWPFAAQHFDKGKHERGSAGDGIPFNIAATDDNGEFTTQELSPGSYSFTMRVGPWIGARQWFDIDLDGAVDKKAEYKVTLKDREVTLTILDDKGKPMPGAKVFASYARGAKWILEEATADDEGKAIFDSLPPLSVYVWGDGVPACAIPADATETTTRDCPFKAGESSYARVGVTLPGTEAVNVTWTITDLGSGGVQKRTDPLAARADGKDHTSSISITGSTRSGMKIDVKMEADGANPRTLELHNIIVPPKDPSASAITLMLEAK